MDWEKVKTPGVPDYRPVKIYTKFATDEERVFFDHDRMPIFGRLTAPDVFERMEGKLCLPEPPRRAKTDLFA